MTAVGMWVLPHEIIMTTDGVAYDYRGIVREVHTKQMIELGWGAIIAAAGTGGSDLILRMYFATAKDEGAPVPPPTGFDELLARLPDAARYVDDHLHHGIERADPEMQHLEPVFQWIIGGYSDERERYEGYYLCNIHDRAFELIPISSFAKPAASEEALAEAGIWPLPTSLDGPQEVSSFAFRLMLAQRKTPMQLHHEDGGAMGHGVGGFCQLTRFRKDGVSTDFVCRWPDRIGETIDPAAPFTWITYGDRVPADADA